MDKLKNKIPKICQLNILINHTKNTKKNYITENVIIFIIKRRVV